MQATKTAPEWKDLNAAADSMGPGAIETPQYQPEIYDRVRRSYPIWGRIKKVKATGHPSRYIEQDAIGLGSWTNPRQITAQRVAPTRLEKFVPLKAISAQLTYGQFDLDLARQSDSFGDLQAKDLLDTIDGVTLTASLGIWNGSDTSLTLPTTLEYTGLTTQITQTATIGLGASIEDGLKAEVAAMVSLQGFTVRPKAIYASPVALDLFDQEMKSIQRSVDKQQIAAGIVVRTLMTQAGELPLIPEPALTSTVVNGHTQYQFVILSEDDVEYHYLVSPEPRVFELGLIANLAQQRVIVQFGAPVAKGPSYAHSVVTLIR